MKGLAFFMVCSVLAGLVFFPAYTALELVLSHDECEGVTFVGWGDVVECRTSAKEAHVRLPTALLLLVGTSATAFFVLRRLIGRSERREGEEFRARMLEEDRRAAD